MKFDPYILDDAIRTDGGEISQLVITEPDALKLANAQRAIDASLNPEATALFSRDLVMACCGIGQKVADLLPLSVTATISEQVMTGLREDVDAYEFDQSQDVIELEEAVQVGAVTYSEIPVREPTTGELIKANSHLRQSQGPAAEMRYNMSIVSQVSGIPITAIHKFPASVVMKAARVIEGFTSAGRGTGGS